MRIIVDQGCSRGVMFIHVNIIRAEVTVLSTEIVLSELQQRRNVRVHSSTHEIR